MECRAEKVISRGLSNRDFFRLAEYIQTTTGIKVPDSKRTMIETRLYKRLQFLGLPSFSHYCDYLFGQGGTGEAVHMIDAVTTNKTEFFREREHFEYLANRAVPDLLRSRAIRAGRTLKVWSSACSTGEEAYTIAMVLAEFGRVWSDLSFTVLATDISTKVLETAREGIYDEGSAGPIPLALRKRYLLRSRDSERKMVKIIPELRRMVDFRRVNLMKEDYGLRTSFDIIFCRNVIIYFSRQIQIRLLTRLCRCLAPGGYIFMGHAETLHGMPLPLTAVATAVYRKEP